jgi:hypothetical protein
LYIHTLGYVHHIPKVQVPLPSPNRLVTNVAWTSFLGLTSNLVLDPPFQSSHSFFQDLQSRVNIHLLPLVLAPVGINFRNTLAGRARKKKGIVPVSAESFIPYLLPCTVLPHLPRLPCLPCLVPQILKGGDSDSGTDLLPSLLSNSLHYLDPISFALPSTVVLFQTYSSSYSSSYPFPVPLPSASSLSLFVCGFLSPSLPSFTLLCFPTHRVHNLREEEKSYPPEEARKFLRAEWDQTSPGLIAQPNQAA